MNYFGRVALVRIANHTQLACRAAVGVALKLPMVLDISIKRYSKKVLKNGPGS